MENIEESIERYYVGAFSNKRKHLAEQLEGLQKGSPAYKDVNKMLVEVDDNLCIFYGILDFCFKQKWVNYKEKYDAYIEFDDKNNQIMYILGNDMSGNPIERSFCLNE